MPDETPSFFYRLFLAWIAYFRVIFDAQFAAGVLRLRETGGLLPPPKEEEAPKRKKARKAS